MLYASMPKWKNWPESLKKILAEGCQMAAEENNHLFAEYEKVAFKRLQENGMIDPRRGPARLRGDRKNGFGRSLTATSGIRDSWIECRPNVGANQKIPINAEGESTVKFWKVAGLGWWTPWRPLFLVVMSFGPGPAGHLSLCPESALVLDLWKCPSSALSGWSGWGASEYMREERQIRIDFAEKYFPRPNPAGASSLLTRSSPWCFLGFVIFYGVQVAESQRERGVRYPSFLPGDPVMPLHRSAES